MTREELVKRSWKAYTIIEYKPPRYDYGIMCMLVAINFDDELMTLMPLDKDTYEQQDIIVNVAHCYVAKKEMKIAK